MRHALHLVLAATCLVAAGVSADEGDGPRHGMRHEMPSFEEVDTNADGSIVADELYAMRAKRMAERAKDGGKLRNAANACAFEEIDTDADGKVSPEEFAAHHAGRRHGPRRQDR